MVQTYLPLIAICSIGFAVEFCWASGEAVLIPYLTYHEVPRWIVSTIYLENPTLGLFVQPRLGAWSDRINQRLPFVIGLTIIALLGTMTLIAANPLSDMMMHLDDVEGDTNYKSYAKSVATALAFIGFGTADICYDCLLIPGRSLLDDLTVPTGKSDRANALFTGFQLAGRLVAMLLASSVLTFSGLFGVYKGDEKHFDACYSLSGCILVFSMLLALLLVKDEGSTYEEILDIKRDDAEDSRLDADCHEEEYLIAEGDKVQSIQHTTSKLSIKIEDSSNDEDDTPITLWGYKPDASILLCAIQTAGWIGVCAQSFFWTSWRGEEMGCIDFVVQSVVGVITSSLLPIANNSFGAANVWCGSELMFHLLMISVVLVTNPIHANGLFPRLISALSGIGYAVHATNGLIVAADVVADPSKRARTIAMVNNTLPMGQLVTALIGGAIAQLFGGFEYVFICFGFLGAVVTSAVWFISLKCSLFNKRRTMVII